MKKITLKISIFLLLTMFGLQVQGQAWNGTLGTYKIKVQGENLYFTLPATGDDITYEAELPGDDDRQLFIFNNHPDGDFFSITSALAGKGVIQTLTVAGTTNPAVGCMGNGPSTDLTTPRQQDKWNPTRGSGTEIFLETDKTGTAWEAQGAKKRFQDSALGAAAKLNGGSAVKFDFIFIAALSNEKFDTSSIFISNPVNNELSIKGLTSNVSKVSVFTLLGSEVLTKNVAGKSAISVNVSGLAAGMYIVKLQGDNGSFSKKIIKQ